MDIFWSLRVLATNLISLRFLRHSEEHGRGSEHATTGMRLLSPYLSFFSLFPFISNSCFWPPNSAAPFPLSLSPSIVSVYSTVISLSMSFRTAENVRVPSFSFRSLSFVSFWSGQLIVPASLSPSFLIVKVDVRFMSPILYSHFHVPTG